MKLWRNEMWLIDAYVTRKLSTKKIAKEAGCAQRTILDWMIKFGIERRTTSEANNNYWENNPNNREIVSQQMLEKWQDVDYKVMQSAARREAWEGDEARKKATIKRLTRTGKEHHNWQGGPIIVECSNCGNGVERPRYHLDRYDYAFCSAVCKSEWWSDNFSGELNPLWKDDKGEYSVEWTHDFREMIRERDNRECVLCGKTKKEQGQRLSVHHIDANKNNTVPENCITLCKSCHAKVHMNFDKYAYVMNNLMISDNFVQESAI